MNDPEVNMLPATRQTDLIAYSKALEGAGLALRLAKGVSPPLRSLADQLVRSACSVPANLAEGHGRFGLDRMQHWRIAYGSANVPRAAIRGCGRGGRRGWEGALHPLADRGASPRPEAASKEVDCHLRLLARAGAVDRRHAETALRLFDEVRAITWRFLHPRKG